MAFAPIHQRWDDTDYQRIGKRVNTKRLINNPLLIKAPSRPLWISPGAPSALPFTFTTFEQSRHFTPYPCDVCKRDRSAHSADWVASSSRAPAVVPDDTFSLSDACPQLGGAHGYVDVLQSTRIPPAHWMPFREAMLTAGVDPYCLTVRDRLIAYVLWEAMMAPQMPRSGFAPGVHGGTLLFLDMYDRKRRIMEVRLFDFLRVLQDKMAEREEEEEDDYDDVDRSDSRSHLSIEAVSTEGGVYIRIPDARSPPSLSVPYMSSHSPFFPPADPLERRYSWCLHSGLLEIGNPYRKPAYRRLLDEHWAANVPDVALAEQPYAAKKQWEREMALAEARDKEKGKGRLVEVDSESEDKDEDEDEEFEDDSDSGDEWEVVRESRHFSCVKQSWSSALGALFSRDAILSPGDTFKGLWKSFKCWSAREEL